MKKSSMTTDWLRTVGEFSSCKSGTVMAVHILVLLHKTILGMYSYFTLPIPHYHTSYVLGQSDMLSLEAHSVLLDQQDKA